MEYGVWEAVTVPVGRVVVVLSFKNWSSSPMTSVSSMCTSAHIGPSQNTAAMLDQSLL